MNSELLGDDASPAMREFKNTVPEAVEIKTFHLNL